MLVSEIIAVAYILLDNATEDELDKVVALEQYAKVSYKMNFEKILGHKTPEIIKDSIEFTDETGISTEALSDFYGDVVHLRFNNRDVPEASIDLLQTYKNAGKQAFAFYTDVEDELNPAKKIEMAIAQTGTLEVWYEPLRTRKQKATDTSEFIEAEKYIIASRLAGELVDYVHYKDPKKQANKPQLLQSIKAEAREWEEIYRERINKVGTDRPFERIPFRAGRIESDY